MAKQEKSAAEKYREERKARLAKASAKNQKKAISKDAGKKAGKVVAVIVVLAIIAAVAWVGISYTGVIEKNTIAVTIGDTKVSQAEYSYYYNNVYNVCYQYAYYGYDIGYDASVTPDAQEYSGAMGEIEGFPEDQTPMWTDFFKYSAEKNLSSIKASLIKAEKEGIALDDADYAEIDSQIAEMKNTAKSNGYSLSAYLRASSGKGISEKLFRQILEEQAVYQKLIDAKTESLKKEFSDAEVENEFASNLTTFAAVSYRSYAVKAEKVETKSEEDETATAAPTEETLKKAKAQADAIAAKAVSEDSFLKAVSETAKETGEENYKDYLKNDSLTLTTDAKAETIYNSTYDEALTTWLFEKTTKAGDTFVAEASGEGYTVYFVTDPVHKPADVYTYDVRHILIKNPEEEVAAEVTETEGEDTAEAETTEAPKAEEVKVETLDTSAYKDVNIYLDVDAETAADKGTYKKAQDILVEYLDGDRTADSFGKLAAKYTEDSNGDKGGLYEDVPVGQMVPQFESWALAKGRKEGDVGIVETTYGCHVMYFVKKTATTWDDTVREALASPKLEKYLVKIVEGDNAVCTVVSENAIAKVEAETLKRIKNQMRNSKNSAY